jgi:hypothetical protein
MLNTLGSVLIGLLALAIYALICLIISEAVSKFVDRFWR